MSNLHYKCGTNLFLSPCLQGGDGEGKARGSGRRTSSTTINGQRGIKKSSWTPEEARKLCLSIGPSSLQRRAWNEQEAGITTQKIILQIFFYQGRWLTTAAVQILYINEHLPKRSAYFYKRNKK